MGQIFRVHPVTQLEKVEDIKPANGRTFTLEEMQAAVGGDIQLVPTDLSDGRICFCDEEGKLKDKPLNMRATILTGLLPHDYIAGDLLVCDPGEVR